MGHDAFSMVLYYSTTEGNVADGPFGAFGICEVARVDYHMGKDVLWWV